MIENACLHRIPKYRILHPYSCRFGDEPWHAYVLKIEGNKKARLGKHILQALYSRDAMKKKDSMGKMMVALLYCKQEAGKEHFQEMKIVDRPKVLGKVVVCACVSAEYNGIVAIEMFGNMFDYYHDVVKATASNEKIAVINQIDHSSNLELDGKKRYTSFLSAENFDFTVSKADSKTLSIIEKIVAYDNEKIVDFMNA